jgi:hypothetical protein
VQNTIQKRSFPTPLFLFFCAQTISTVKLDDWSRIILLENDESVEPEHTKRFQNIVKMFEKEILGDEGLIQRRQYFDLVDFVLVLRESAREQFPEKMDPT